MKLIFTRGPLLGLRLCTLIIISILLMVMDHKQQYLVFVRNALSIAVAPLQYTVDWPHKLLMRGKENLTSHQALLLENAELRKKELISEAHLQKMSMLEQENIQLRALLKSPARNGNERLLVAQLLEVASDTMVQELILDKGSGDDIYVGQPVIDAAGILGQVIQTSLLNSHVLLISDVRSAIPVQNSRTGIRGILVGTGNLEKLVLLNTPATVDVRVGDLLVSSGLGGHFPANYHVGIVTMVKHNPGDQFAIIDAKPCANLNRNQQVLLIWPEINNPLITKKLADTQPVAAIATNPPTSNTRSSD